MGNKNFTRRHFFRKLTASPATDTPDNTEDPLFQKFSRKKLTPRRYSTEEMVLKVGEEDKEDAQRVGPGVTSGLVPYTGTWSEFEVLHLLRRTNFGWKKAWVDALLPMGASAAVDAVLNVNYTPPAPPVNWYQNFFADESGIAGNNDATNPAVGLGADWTNHYFSSYNNANNTAHPTDNGQTTNHYRMDSLRRWLFGLTINGDYTIREKMVWFWYHFIPVDFEAIYQSSNSYVSNNCARILYRYMKLFRDNALTNNPAPNSAASFKELIKKVAMEPAMMFYLNNNANTVTAPDENFGRELMELFTLGKDVNSPLRYTEDDVKAAARALTGWRVNGLNTANVTTDMVLTNTTSGRKHDPNAKVFSSNFGTGATIAASTNPATWAGELDQLLNLIFGSDQQDGLAKYICRRIYRFFVYYDIDANIETNVIAPLAQTFISNNWNIKPVMAQLLKSQHFYDAANRGCYIKTPFDLVAGLLNNFNLNTADNNIEYQYRIWSKYNDGYCLGMEQQMGTIPNVSGWNAFYQTPAYHQYWINSNCIQKRYSFIQECISGYHTVSSVIDPATNAARRFSVDTVAFASQFGNTVARDPDELIKASIKYLLPNPNLPPAEQMTQQKRDEMKGRTLLYNQSITSNSYWTTAWDNYVAAPADATKRKTVEDGLKRLYNEICQLAEYQLM